MATVYMNYSFSSIYYITVLGRLIQFYDFYNVVAFERNTL